MDMPVRIMRRFAGRVLDTLYPPRCVACRRSGDWWCASCRDAVERLTNRPCSRCLATDLRHVCNGTLPFAGVVSTGFYHSRPLRRLIAELKFQGMTAVGADLESYLRDWSASFPWAGETTIAIQPMPLAPGRERHRGFNQGAGVAGRGANVTVDSTRPRGSRSGCAWRGTSRATGPPCLRAVRPRLPRPT